MFHKILKSGCKVEESKLRTSERLVKLTALYCLIGWRIFWLTMQFRANPEQPAGTIFTKLEIKLLDKVKGAPHPDAPPCLGHYFLNWRNSVAISRVPVIRHPATKSSGAASPA